MVLTYRNYNWTTKFFKWAIDNLIIEFIKQNYKEIENDMNTCYNAVKIQKKRRKMKEREDKNFLNPHQED